MVQNKRWVYKKIPQGIPKVDQDITTEAGDFDVNQSPPSGGLVVKVLWASLDPYLRGAMRPTEIKSYRPAFEANDVIVNSTVSKVIKSDSPKAKEGDFVVAYTHIAEYAVVAKPYVEHDTFYVIPKERSEKLRLSYYVGVLGMPGRTAYSSIYKIGEPKKGETIWITAASGPVGATAGQLAKHLGLKVIGSVGSDDKLKYITDDLKFDAGFNYKKEKPAEAIKRLAPNGVDIYFDNVGGEHLAAAFDAANPFARFIECGQVSEYSTPIEDRYPVKNLMNIVGKRLKIQGFIVGDPGFGDKYFHEHIDTISKWIADGSFTVREHVIDGVDNASQGFLDMLSGKNDGKSVIKIADE